MDFTETTQSIDFSAIGATNILPLDITDAVFREKLSVSLINEYLKGEEKKSWPVLKYNEFVHPKRGTDDDRPDEERDFFFTVDKGSHKYHLSKFGFQIFCFDQVMENKINYGKLHYEPEAICVPLKSGTPMEEISVIDAMRTIDDYSDTVRIKELSTLCHIGSDTYSSFVLPPALKLQQFPDYLQTSPNSDKDMFEAFQRDLRCWYKTSYPRNYIYRNWANTSPHKAAGHVEWTLQTVGKKNTLLPQPVFYKPIGSMVYSIRMFQSLPEMRLYRVFLNPDGCGLREALIPAIYVQETENGNLYQHTVMAGLPNIELLPLWNLDRIMLPSTDTIVLCGCIQDAEALQRDNDDVKNVAFTSWVADRPEQVDFTPIAKKNIIFLISNHNGGTLADAYEEIAKVFESIKKANIKIKDCVFQQREVEYPDNSLTISTPGALASAYFHTPPKIVSKSLLPPMDETEFFAMLAKIRKEREAPPFWAPVEQKPVKKNPAEGILIRSFLYRNAITVLAGPPSAGKSRFCRSLIRYLVKGNDRQYMKERFWTRCCAKSPMKILYWNFDCIPDLESWKEICLRGLNQDQKDNIFIEDAPTEEDFFDKVYGRPDVGAYRRKLAKYTFKGTPGHPLDLLIVDTLVSVWNKKNIEGSLHFLNQLMKSVPGMAVLAIHHTTELGKPLGGGDPKRMPRIVMTMERINQTVKLDSSGKQSTKKKKDEKKIVTSLYKFRYDKFSTSHADVEELPFYCVREDEDMYSVYKPVCTRDEMFGSLVYHYRNNDDAHPSNKVIGAMLGYSNREVQKRAIDEKKYFTILKKAQKTAPLEDESSPNRKKQSKK